MEDWKVLAKFRVSEGVHRLHLNHPDFEWVGTHRVRREPAVVVLSPRLIVFENSTAGTLKGQEIVDAIRDNPRFRSGVIRDITDGDPLDVGEQKRMGLMAQKKREDDLQARVDELEEALEAAIENDSMADLKALRKQLREAKAEKYSCPYCDWKPRSKNDKGKPISDKKRESGLRSHLEACKDKPKSIDEINSLKAEMPSSFPNVRTPDGDPDIDKVSTAELAKQKE